MSELISSHRKEALRAILRRLHAGEPLPALKEEFRQAVGDITPLEIAQIEGELVAEGISPEEIRKLCDLHLELFRESLEKEEPLAPAWHPIGILMAEHRELLRIPQLLIQAVDANTKRKSSISANTCGSPKSITSGRRTFFFLSWRSTGLWSRPA